MGVYSFCRTSSPSANQAGKDHSCGGEMCVQSYHVMTSQGYQRFPVNSYQCCAVAENFTATSDQNSSTRRVRSLDLWGQLLNLDINHDHATHPLPLLTSQLWSKKILDRPEVCDIDDISKKLNELHLVELIGDEDDQDLIPRTQKLLDDDNLDTTTKASLNITRECCCVPVVVASSCSSWTCSSVLGNTLRSIILSHGVKGEHASQTKSSHARGNALTRYRPKKRRRVEY